MAKRNRICFTPTKADFEILWMLEQDFGTSQATIIRSAIRHHAERLYRKPISEILNGENEKGGIANEVGSEGSETG